MKYKDKLIFLFLIIVLAAFSRLMPHLPNFTPLAAIAIWTSIYFSKKFFWLPMLILLISDFWIGFYDWKLMLAVYASFILIGFFGVFLKKSKSWYRVLGVSILGSVLFFIITNFAVWAFSPWYQKTVFGLINCYLMGIPFLKNMVLADVLYLSMFVSVSELVVQYFKITYQKKLKEL